MILSEKYNDFVEDCISLSTSVIGNEYSLTICKSSNNGIYQGTNRNWSKLQHILHHLGGGGDGTGNMLYVINI